MKYLSTIALALVVMLSSCSMETETYVNKDGSGSSAFTLDMGDMMSLGGLGDMMGGMEEPGMSGDEEEMSGEKMDDMMGEEEMPMKKDEEEEIKEVDDIFKLLDSDVPVDTVQSFLAMAPDSVKNMLSAEDAALLDKIKARVISNKDEGIGKMIMSMEYDSQEEYGKMMHLIEEMENDEEDSDFTGMFNPMQVDYERGVVIIPEMDYNDAFGEAGMPGGMGGMGGPGGEEEGEDEDDEGFMEMMSMMFGDSGFKNTYHLPGEIEFTNMTDAVINGNTVTFNIPLAEFMDNMKTPKYVIKYKK